MTSLSKCDIDYITRHDWEVHRRHGYPNRNRFYTYLVRPLFSPDLEVHMVAVKSARRIGANGDRVTYVKEVFRASVDDPDMEVKDIAHGMLAGYIVDWSKEKLNHVSWSYDGKWSTTPYKLRSGLWKLVCEVINPAVLTHHERFQYCAWNRDCGHILDYLKVYVKHPRIELLAKVGAGQFATRAGFIAQLERNKGLMRFFSSNLEEIKSKGYGCDVIRIAFKHGISLAETRRRIDITSEFRKMGLPGGVDALRALDYVSRTKGCTAWEYCEYLNDCVTLGYDLADTKTAFPKQFKKRQTIVKDLIAEIRRREEAKRRREQAELTKRMDADIAAIAKRFARLEKVRASFRIVLPRKSDDLVREGQRLHNCLGDGHYAARIARGESLIAFIRRAKTVGRSFVAVEYSPRQKKVLQCYGAHNSKPDQAILKFVERVFAKKFPSRRKAA